MSEVSKTTDLQDLQQQVEIVEEDNSRSTRRRYTFERHFHQLRRALELAISDATLNGYASQFGYDNIRLAEGKAFSDALETAYENQKKARADQLEASQIFNEKKELAQASVRHMVQTARLAFKDDRAAYQSMGLGEARKKAYGDWLAQHKLMYNQLLSRPGAVEQIAKFNVTLEQIQAALAELLDSMEADKNHEHFKAESQKTTELKNRAFNDFSTWMRGFLKVMTVALENDPQMKEKLGIVTPMQV